MKNWTLRQRILASFAVIIAIMLLMVVVSFSRLMKIDASAEKVRTDAVPGVYFSSMMRGAWVDSYNLTQQIVGLSGRREITPADHAMYKSFEERLSEQMVSYRKTIFTPQDQAAFDEFEARHQLFNQEMTNVLDLYQRKEYEPARLALEQKLTPAWVNGRKQLNTLIEMNHDLSDRATLSIGEAVTDAKISMGVSLLVAIIVAGLCGLLLMRAIMAPMNRI
ncbi:MAG TPA: MCP four helix bundle domain-containing protein, partial [Candidatus Udaeobacter sp.]|nr:MCP four helix bundle domain-containing protein [Candidatus Udaeobacter sp.]